MSHPAGAGESTRRLFFCLWPNEALRAELKAAQRALLAPDGGRWTTAANLHLTLAFLGPVTTAEQRAAVLLAGSLRHPPFEFAIDQFGCWPGPGIAWLGCREPAPALLGLAAALEAAIPGTRRSATPRAFSPHVTLARHYRCEGGPAPLSRVIQWVAGDIALAESISDGGGVQYRVIDKWVLA